MISVRDEGGGFAEKDRDRIFDKSVRLVEGGRGLGLGLFVAREIIDAHHGRLVASSADGEGAVFEVSVPA
jgi:signal transduction histidine kinase